jgi:hypothetical protein
VVFFTFLGRFLRGGVVGISDLAATVGISSCDSSFVLIVTRSS